MEAQELLTEAPYTHDGEMKREPTGKLFTSDTSLKRLYVPFGEIDTPHGNVRFYFQSPLRVIGIVPGIKPDTKEASNEIIFMLRFKRKNTIVVVPKEIQKAKILQVEKASASMKYEGVGIASFVYAKLAADGYVVISDTSQFADGKMLWKKLAKQAHLKDYEVYILDDEYGFKKDDDGQLIKYDSSNIDDADIWSSGMDISKEHVLLVMKQ